MGLVRIVSAKSARIAIAVVRHSLMPTVVFPDCGELRLIVILARRKMLVEPDALNCCGAPNRKPRVRKNQLFFSHKDTYHAEPADQSNSAALSRD